MTEPARIGIIGCGTISRKYLRTIAQLPSLQLVACADLLPDRAALAAQDRASVRAVSVDELIMSSDIDIVLNLTLPAAHAAVTTHALQAGKHTYSEKPLALTLTDGKAILAAAAADRLVGCAPDTVLGTGIQTARAALDRGDVGRPIAAAAFLTSGGPANIHPTPQFLYQPGGGPLFDMGPYYITALISLLGPVRRVAAMANTPKQQRHIASGPNAGLKLDINIETHVSATLQHDDGTLTTLVTSWEAPAGSRLPRIEIYGDAGTLGVPDPNQFSGPVVARASRSAEWSELGVLAGYQHTERGVGLLDLAHAVRAGRPPRASAAIALHTLDVITSTLESARSGATITLSTTCQRPSIVPLNDPRIEP